VWLARSLGHLIQILESLGEQSVGFRWLTEAINTTSPGGRLVFHIFGAIVEFERAIVRERTRAGLAAARSRGKKGGRQPVLGPRELQQAKAMLRDPAISIAEVAERLGVAQSTLFRQLRGGRGALERAGPDE
jgi:DNA invertase Pin-like site-specific DNA recombinase